MEAPTRWLGPATPIDVRIMQLGDAWDTLPDEVWREIGAERTRYLVAQERWAIATMPDGLLAELLARLRRQLVMAGEDDLPGWLLELVHERFDLAQREWEWRKRAAERGGPKLLVGDWRERVERVKRESDLALLIAYECDLARPSGPGKWMCRCPFHPDKNPSLSIDVEKGLWLCFGCQAGGDCFTYVELRYGLDFASAVRHLEQRL